MHALLYMTRQGLKNRIKKAMRKPLTYVALVVCVAYAALIVSGWATFAKSSGNFGLSIFIYIMTLSIYFFFCSNFVTYAKLRGVIFQKSHSHMIFPAPLSPKLILLYGAMKNFIINFVIYLVITLVGITVFHISIGRALLLFFVLFVFESMFEGGLIVFLYAKEEKYNLLVKVICKSIYVLLGVFALLVVYYLKKNGFSIVSLGELFRLPVLQMIPFVGWAVSAVWLIIDVPTTISIVGTILFVLCGVSMFFVAYRMKCTGAYYEDAAKFADDYAELKNKGKNGEMAFSIGKKKSYRKVQMHSNATGAKAIFVRQLLEYKKEKFFIFTGTTVFSFVAVLLCVFVISIPKSVPPGLAMLGVMAYFIFISTGILGKWNKEIANFYLYLIPDSAAKKLWYATAMEHVKALLDGTIMAVGIGIAWKIPIWQIIICIIVYVVLQANRLYIKILSECILGSIFGATAKSLFTMLLQGGVLGSGIGVAALIGFLVNYNLVFPIILFYSMMVTVLIAWLTITRFETMEQWD